MKRVFWKIPAILAVFGLALGMAGCPTEVETNGPTAGAFRLVTINVTGIPEEHQNQSASLSLHHLISGGWATGDWVNQVEGTSASFAFAAFPGTYGVRLRFDSVYYYIIPSRNITAGNHSIPFSAFTPFEQVSVTVTGIPDQYIGSSGSMHIMHPGTFARQVDWITSQTISEASATFTTSIVPGSYDIHLRFFDTLWDGSWNLIRAYSAPLRNIAAGTNTIPFSYFDVVESITVTLTGIPDRYIGDADVIAYVAIILNTPGLIDWVAYDVGMRPIESSSATSTFFFLPGIYDVFLQLSYETAENVWISVMYSAPSRNITAGTNTIPFSVFTIPPSMSITVTGIPSEYIGGRSNRIDLVFPNTNVFIAGGGISITDDSATTDFFWRFDDGAFNTAGTYGVYLLFDDFGWNTAEYFIPSRHLNAGSNIIPFSAFTRVASDASSSVRGFTENAQSAGQSVNRTMPGRFGARTHPLTDR